MYIGHKDLQMYSVVPLVLASLCAATTSQPVRMLGPGMWQLRAATLDRQLASAAVATTAVRTPIAPFDRMGTARHGAQPPLPTEVVANPRPEEYLDDAALPSAWDWRSVLVAPSTPPVHFVTRIRNQFLPYWCGSCWAHAATAVLGSRWLIHAANATDSGVDFSVQYFINCVKNASRGCHGGSSYEAFALAHSVGAVDSSCLPYRAFNQNCTAMNTCEQNLNGIPPVHIQSAKPHRYFAAEFGVVGSGADTAAVMENKMMKEIYARGPVASCMACPGEFENDYKGGVFATTDNRTVCDHIVAVVGFGGTGKESYWVVQNSFGSVWGELGYFRIKRSSALQGHEHNLGIEKDVSWAMPDTSVQV